MKYTNKIKRLIFLFIIVTFISSCIKERNIVPPVKGIPSAGLLAAEVKTVNGNLVTFRLDLFAVNHYGQFIESLDTDCLKVNDDYPKADLVSIKKGTNENKGPYSAALLFDQSGSMRDNDPDDARVTAGKAFIDIMNSGEEVAITAFSGSGIYPNNPTVLNGFSSDKNQLKRIIDDLDGNEGGGTPLYNSIFNLLEYVNTNAKNDNKAIIVMTDGQSTSGPSSSSIISEANLQGVEVYTIGLGYDTDLDKLQQIALGTGGAVMQAQDAIQLISLYNSLADLLRGNGVFYETCWQLKKPNGGDWQSGDVITTVIDLLIPTGEVIEMRVQIEIP